MTQTTPTAPPQMDLWRAAATCGWRKYSDFSGRATRAELWWWQVFIHLVNLILAIPDTAFLTEDIIAWGPLGWTLGIVIFLPGLAVTVRRLHDIGKSGWWQLVWLICIVLGAVPLAVGFPLTLRNIGANLNNFEMDALSDASSSDLQPLIIGVALTLAILLATFIWYVVWMARQGEEGPNRYGPDPRAAVPAPEPQAPAEA